MNIRYAPESIEDLARLRRFIEVKNPDAARRIVQSLLARIEKLSEFPLMGLPVSGAPVPEQMRDLFVGDYTVRYLVASHSIYILRIWHGKETEKDLIDPSL